MHYEKHESLVFFFLVRDVGWVFGRMPSEGMEGCACMHVSMRMWESNVMDETGEAEYASNELAQQERFEGGVGGSEALRAISQRTHHERTVVHIRRRRGAMRDGKL